MNQPRQLVFHIKVDHTEGYVRVESEEKLIRLLKDYGVKDFTITRAPGKSRIATSVYECIRDKLRKQK